MRLLHVICSMNPAAGGPVEGVQQLAQINRKKGHEIEVLCTDDPKSPWLQNSEIKIYAFGPAKLGQYSFCWKLTQWLRKNHHHYDCVIINGIWNYNAFGGWLALRKGKTPYIVFTHGMLDPWFKKAHPLKHLKKWLYWPWGLYPVLRDAKAVIFTCEMECKLARESFWLYKCNEVVINYGTAGIPQPDHDYRPDFFQAHPELAGKRIFLFLGRVSPKKGPDLLIESVGEMRRAGEWDPATMRLVMAGPTDSAYAQELQDMVKKEKIEDSVYWTGLILGDQKWGALQSAEAFVLPSHQENFGIAVAEALSCGTPVLISHSVNISPEIAADGAGFAEEDTRAGCLRLLRKWFSLPAGAQNQMCQQAKITFRNRYTSKQSAHDLIMAIGRAVNG